jgi:hypothetical protein
MVIGAAAARRALARLSHPEVRVELEEPMMHCHCTAGPPFDRFWFLHDALREVEKAAYGFQP